MDISKIIARILLASTALTLTTMAPAMAQPQEGVVAVGPIGSTNRQWMTPAQAQQFCAQQPCWATEGLMIGENQWVNHSLFPGAKVITEPGTGYRLLEVQPR